MTSFPWTSGAHVSDFQCRSSCSGTHCLPARALSPHVPEVPSCLLTIAKTGARFSAFTIDQSHEQNNAMVKGEGGTVGLTENPSALRRWMLSGSEMARLVNEFHTSASPETNWSPGFTTKPRKVFRQHSTEMSSHLYKSLKTLVTRLRKRAQN